MRLALASAFWEELAAREVGEVMVLGLDGPFAAGSHSHLGRLNDVPPGFSCVHAPGQNVFRNRGSFAQNPGGRNHAETALHVNGGYQHLGFGFADAASPEVR